MEERPPSAWGFVMLLPRRFAVAFFVVWWGSVSVSYSQVKFPKPPENYEVQIRYQIAADRIQRFRQFDEMTNAFKSLGFKQTETEESETDAENPTANRMAGQIPSTRARELLRERHVKSILLSPSEYKIPDKKGERVKVLIELEKSLPFIQQQLLFNQSVQLLTEKLAFSNGISYDHRNYTVIRGTIDATSIPLLMLDLRTIPNGWFFTEAPLTDLPNPLRQVVPIRLVELIPEPEKVPAAITPPPAAPRLDVSPETLSKISVELQRLIAASPDQPARIEIFLNSVPKTLGDEGRRLLNTALDDLQVEGRLGAIYTAKIARAADVIRLATIQNVTTIRLPRMATPSIAPAPPAAPEKEPETKEKTSLKRDIQQVTNRGDALREVGLDRLHALNKRGYGIRIILVDTDFAGFNNYLGKGLPAKTKLIDLTAERQSSVLPDPSQTPEGQIGHGTHCALAASVAAPDAELTLVRIDAATPYQLQTVLRFVSGEVFDPLALRLRLAEFDLDMKTLQAKSAQVLEDYRKALDRFEDSLEAEAERKKVLQAIKDLDAIEGLLLKRIQRLQKLEADLNGLKGADIIISPLVWNTGHAFDGSSYLSQLIDDKLTVATPLLERRKIGPGPKLPLWFNAVGDSRGQAWFGQFSDLDGNGIMEFGSAKDLPPKDRWTRELNFLTFESLKGEAIPNLPVGAKVRITIQWREPHDPELSELEYREPTTTLGLTLFRQRDPSGESVPSDELEIAAINDSSAIRLLNGNHFGIYEKTLELTVASEGRYALRVEGEIPKSNRPRNTPFLPGNEIQFDLTPRIFVEVLDNETRAKGRIVFRDFNCLLGGVGMPADARQVHAVGASSLDRQPRLFSGVGGGPGIQIIQKPDIWSFDELPIPNGPARGSSLSTSFAGGIAASMLSAGAGHSDFLNSVGIKRRQILEVSEEWFSKLLKR